jgi:hypothetical protein
MSPENEETLAERLFFHEDDAFHVRTDWFLIGHGILLEALFSAKGTAATCLVCLFGVSAAFVWLGVSLRHIPALNKQKRDFQNASIIYKRRQDGRALHDSMNRGSWLRWHATWAFGIALPKMCLVTWLLLGAAGAEVWELANSHCDVVARTLRGLADNGAGHVIAVLIVVLIVAVLAVVHRSEAAREVEEAKREAERVAQAPTEER